MAGRIRDESIQLVRERAAIDQVIAEAGVSLRSAGGGRLKGLCPFHDEKSPSFNVNPANGYYMCFGCGESGDVISFVTKHDQMSFPEAVEHLARRYGVDLQYEEGGQAARSSTSQRTRLLQAHKAAAEFYASSSAAAEAVVGRQFLAERGFDQAAAQVYGVGFAPQGWDALTKHLRSKGFTPEELLAAGLSGQSRSGSLIDKFRGRLIWPIRDIGGEVIGFGARKALDRGDTRPKVPQHPRDADLQEVLGALRPRPRQEGDRPAPAGRRRRGLHRRDGLPPRRRADGDRDLRHGVRCRPHRGHPPAAHGPGRVPRRGHLHLRRRRGRAEGSAEGLRRRPALRGADLHRGQPGRHGPVRAPARQGRQGRDATWWRRGCRWSSSPSRRGSRASTSRPPRAGCRPSATPPPLVAKIKDRSLRPEYARRLAGWLGMEVEPVVSRVYEFSGDRSPGQRRVPPKPTADAALLQLEREALKLAVQAPFSVAPIFDELHEEVFTDEGHRMVHETVRKAGGVSQAVGGEAWVARLLEQASSDVVRQAVTGLAVEAPLTDWELPVRPGDPDAAADARRDAPRRRAQGPAAAHQPGRGARALQPDVRRAHRAGEDRPGVPRGRHQQPVKLLLKDCVPASRLRSAFW